MGEHQDLERQNSEKRFIVVLRGPSVPVFREGENLKIENFQTEMGKVEITYTSRWIQRRPDLTLPGHLWIEVQGSGRSLEDVIVPLANAGLSMLPIIAVCTNAAIGEPEVELAFENTPGATERDYFQCYVPPETAIIHNARLVRVKETVAVIDALAKHPDSERLRRGANQYRLALEAWRLGRESIALAHLWMALEAITKAKIRTELGRRNLAKEKELADSLDVPLKDLDPTVRKALILEGDTDCYRKAKEASDGFEHGFLDFSKIIENAKDVRHRMARYVRKAILEMLDLEQSDLETLEKLGKPLGYWPIVKYFRGKLISDEDTLAPKGKAYPFLRWKPIIKNLSITQDGKFNYVLTESLTAELGEGVLFKPQSIEIWQAE